MTGSQKLAVGSSNRRISFYDLKSNKTFLAANMNSTDSQFGGGESENGYDMGKTKIYSVPTDRFEDLLAVPTCMEYYKWPSNNSDSKYETLLVGDSIGIITVYNFKKEGWHHCVYRVTSDDLNPKKLEDKMKVSSSKANLSDVLTCCRQEYIKAFNENVEDSFK